MISKDKTYDEMVRDFGWNLPDKLNMGIACCDAISDKDPNRIALMEWPAETGKATTYGELRELSNRLANRLNDLGAVKGDRIAIILPQSLETVVAHLAIYKAGMIAVPLARLFQPEALEYRLQNAGVSIVITNADGAAKVDSIKANLPELRQVMVADSQDWRQILASHSPEYVPVETTPDTPALIIFTSGTTGPPKGALHGHRVLIGHIPGLKVHHEFIPQEDDVAWTPADWAWAGGLLNILLPCLYMGVPVVYGGLDRFDPERAFQLMAEMKVRNAFIPPTALRLMRSVEKPAEKYPFSLRTIGSGGESLGAETHQWAARELGLQINEFYGQTECNLVLSAFGAAGVMRPGSIGKPVPGHNVAVIDDKGKPVPPETRGQVAIKRPDPVMFLEYWNDREATKDKFLDDWMLTGDQCIVDSDGYFHFVGRDDDIISVAGYRVGPGEIEDCLLSHPAVQLSAAVGKPDKLKGQVVKAFVVLADGHIPGDVLADEIKHHVKARLAANIFPREIEFVDEIPLTTTGKVIRRVFRDQVRRDADA